MLDNAGPESFETNLSTKSHDTEPLGNRENSSTRLSAALFLVASRFYFKPSSKIQETYCAQAVGSAGQSQRVRQGQLPNFLPLQQWNAPGANFGLGIPGEGQRHARSGSRPLVDLLQAVVCELFCMSILGVRVPDVGCFPLCFLCPCLRPNWSSRAGRWCSSWHSRGKQGFLFAGHCRPHDSWHQVLLAKPTWCSFWFHFAPKLGSRSWLELRGGKRKLRLLAGCNFFVENFCCATCCSCLLWSGLNYFGLFCVWQASLEGFVGGWMSFWIFIANYFFCVTVVSFALQCIKLHFSLDCSVSYRRPLKDSSEAQCLLECSLQIPCVQLLSGSLCCQPL